MGYATSAVGDATAAICDLYDDLPEAEKEDFLDALWEVIDNYRGRVVTPIAQLDENDIGWPDRHKMERCPECGRDGDASLMAAHRLTHGGTVRRVQP